MPQYIASGRTVIITARQLIWLVEEGAKRSYYVTRDIKRVWLGKANVVWMCHDQATEPETIIQE